MSYDFGRGGGHAVRRLLSACLVCIMLLGLLPSGALANTPLCGIEEHTHSRECYAVYDGRELACEYEARYVHEHGASCYDADGNLTCMTADFVLHKHDENCYDSDGNLICTMEERNESVHGLADYDAVNAVCVWRPYFEHVHGPECYRTEKVLVCELEETSDAHRHGPDCYERQLTCGIEILDGVPGTEAGAGESDAGTVENPGDETVSDGDAVTDAGHEDGIGAADGAVLGTEPDGTGEPGEPVESGDGGDGGSGEASLLHEHTASCYTDVLVCDLVETGHAHDDSCYETRQVLDCKYVEDGNPDAGSDGMPVCVHYTYEEHTHDSSCYDGQGRVICGKWELKSHQHNETCFKDEILSYDSETPTCGKDEHKHGLFCYFENKTEELDAFLSGYEEFKAAVESGEYDLDSEDGKAALAEAAVAVKRIASTFDEDVLAFDSVKEMLAYLDQYIPEDGAAANPGELIGDVVCTYTPGLDLRVVVPVDEGPYSCQVNLLELDFHGLSAPDMSGYPFEVRDGTFVSMPAIGFYEDGTYEFRLSMGGCSGCLPDTRAQTLTVTVTTVDGTTGVAAVYSREGYAGTDGESAPDGFELILRPSLDNAKTYPSSVRDKARAIMSRMTPEQMAGQMLLPHFSGNSGGGADYVALIEAYHVGGFILFDADTRDRDPESLRAVLADAQVKGKAANNGVGMIASVDEEGGRRSNGTLINRVSNWPQYGHEPFVSGKEAYEAGGFSNVEAQEAEKARFLTDLGFNMVHAPVLDLAKTGYVSGRSFSDDGVRTAEYAVHAIRGLDSGNIGISMKHFPGYGNTGLDTHNGFAYNDLSEVQFEYNELVPFYAGMAVGGDVIMVTHNAIGYLHPDAGDDIDCASCDPAVYAMARDMGFDGIMMTDDLNMAAVTSKYGSGAVAALRAGADIALTGNYADLAAVRAAVGDGTIPASRVRESVERILCWKFDHGLIDDSAVPSEPVVPGAEAVRMNDFGGIVSSGTLVAMLSEARASTDGKYVRLLTDVSLGIDIRLYGGVTLDLAGHCVKPRFFDVCQSGFGDSGIARIVDSSGGGSFSYFAADLPDRYASSSWDGVDVDAGSFTASWYGTENGAGVRRSLDLGGAGRIVPYVGMYIDAGAHLRLESGAVQGYVHVGSHSTFESVGGWLFSTTRSGSVVEADDTAAVSFSGGGIVGCSVNVSGSANASVVRGGGSVEAHDAYFVGNSSPSGVFGGASVQHGSDLTSMRAVPTSISGCEFSGNETSKQGTVSCSGELSVTGSSFLYNVSKFGGGVCVPVWSNSDAVISGCSFIGNKAVSGGGISCGGETGTVSVSGCSFVNCVADEKGGAIYGRDDRTSWVVPASSVLRVSDCSFSDCVADGGTMTAGHFIDFTMDRLYLEDVVFPKAPGYNYAVVPFKPTASCSVSGKVVIEGPIPKLEAGNTFFAYGSLSPDTRILVSVARTLTDEDEVLICTAAEGVDISERAHCFVAQYGYKTWYDREQDAIMYGTKDHAVSTGPVSDVSGVVLDYRATVRVPDTNRRTDNSVKLDTVDNSFKANMSGSWDGMYPNAFSGSQGGFLPRNVFVTKGGPYDDTWPIRNVYLAAVDGSSGSIPSGNLTGGYTIATHSVDIEVYSPDVFPDGAAVGQLDGRKLSEFNKFGRGAGSYRVSEIVVQAKDGDAVTIPWSEDLYFTSDADDASPNAVLLQDDVRFVFHAVPVETEQSVRAVFYDYDAPINSSGNYSDGVSSKLAVRYQDNYNFDRFARLPGTGYMINAANRGSSGTTESFRACCFGIARELDSSGNIVWTDGVGDPGFFDADGVGKTAYGDAKLFFNRVGDTLTLDKVGIRTPQDNGFIIRSTGLSEFGRYSNVWSNNFWPLDTLPGHDDPGIGADDGKPHNYYFGMHYALTFDLDADYAGPMSYQFFGDDDLWVFLDGHLVCDVGGIHQTAGQYVDLRDYLPVGSSGTHELAVYFIERGGYGSCCWMQMNLPNPVFSSTDNVPEDASGDVRIVKRVSGIEDCSETFSVRVDVYDKAGVLANDRFVGRVIDLTDNSLVEGVAAVSGVPLFIGPDQAIVMNKVPLGYTVRATEILTDAQAKFWSLSGADGDGYVEAVVGLDETEVLLLNEYHPGGRLRISKVVVDGNNYVIDDCVDTFHFTASLYGADGVTPSQGRYAYNVYRISDDGDYGSAEPVGTGVLWHNCSGIEIPANCILVTDWIPETVQYEISELPADTAFRGYTLVSADNNAGVLDWNVQDVRFVNAYADDVPKLPSTGGRGAMQYWGYGVSLLAFAMLVMLNRPGRNRRRLT